jgi:hypothetical protein
MWPVPRIYNKEHLQLRESPETAVRRVAGVRQSPANKDVNTGAEEATTLEAITKRQ